MAPAIGGVEFQISVILLASLAGFFLASRFRQSGVVGSILAGILIGPSFLGLVTYSATIQALATIGAIFLLFAVGLETKFEDLKNPRAAAVAFLGVILPWIGGFLVSRLFGFRGVEAFFIGTALTATSVAVTVQVMRELGKLSTPAAKTIIGAAVMDDVLGLLALSIAQQFAASGTISLPSLLFRLALAAAFLAAGLFVGQRYVSVRLRELHDWAMVHRAYEHAPFLASVLVAFVYSVAAELAGLSAIVGAFIAGISLEHLEVGDHKEGSRYLEILFGSVFFVSLGLLVDIRWSLTPFSLAFVLLLTAVALLAKFVAGYAASRATRMGREDSLVVGVGMMPRGEIALVTALIGMNAGILSRGTFSAIVLVGVLTTVVTPIALVRLYGERPLRQRVKIY